MQSFGARRGPRRAPASEPGAPGLRGSGCLRVPLAVAAASGPRPYAAVACCCLGAAGTIQTVRPSPYSQTRPLDRARGGQSPTQPESELRTEPGRTAVQCRRPRRGPVSRARNNAIESSLCDYVCYFRCPGPRWLRKKDGWKDSNSRSISMAAATGGAGRSQVAPGAACAHRHCGGT